MNTGKSSYAISAIVVALLAATVVSNRLQHNQATDTVDALFRDQISDVIIQIDGRVHRILPDDREGSKHQRFIVETESGLTVLIAHNIDLAPRVKDIKVGDSISVRGEYEWNDKGGVIHWTHRDPQGRRDGGWVEYKGTRYH